MKRRVLLHNIRSAYNVGSIFRTADGAGVDHIYFSGYTPRPTDRFGRTQPEIEKTSLGASKSVPWTDWGDDPVGQLTQLKADGWYVVAVEQDSSSVSVYEYRPKDRTIYIFGNEVEGVSHDLLEEADEIVEIPMHGTKESLNVAVSAGVVLFRT
ncbi:MAG: TrmH family RNA methyltransferase [Candidatus Paceibacterota bacterium]